MRQQFLYGRKNAGYCQLNQDDYIASGDDLLRLATLQNYIPVDGMNLDDLPLEYYAYTDEIDGARVWIEGLTSFVPGGTSAESGSRDTSMVHKYIYFGEDFKRHIGAEEKAETERKTRRFYRTVEGYRQGAGEDIELDEDSKIKFLDLEKAFGFDGDDGGEKLEDFIVCCLDSFPRPERRVYCYLPSADREGSLYAKSLMEALLKVLPPCVNAGAGFITYSPTFHNASTNPIPGNISVIFIPDTFNNRQWEVSERNKSYIFDFRDYEKQNKLEHYEDIKDFIKALINEMRLKTSSDYETLMKYVKYDAVVDADFLSSFCSLAKHMVRLKNVGDEKEAGACCGDIGNVIGKLLEFEDALTEWGKDMILQDVEQVLRHCKYTKADLEWIDNIYKSGELCRKQILNHLCDACLRFAEKAQPDQNEEILTITNFDYSDADLNDSILSIIYSNDKYFLVGQRLISETLNPLRKSTKKTASEKRALLMSSVGALYNKYRYHEFVTSDYCKMELSDFLADCMQEAESIDDMQEEMSAVSEAISKMDRTFQEAYYPVLQELSYLVVQKFVKSMWSRNQHVGGPELEYCEDLLKRYGLAAYEEEKKQETFYVEKLVKAIRKNKLQQALGSEDTIKSTDVKKVLEVFRQYSFEDAVAACDDNSSRVKEYLVAFENYGYGDSQKEREDWEELFLYFCCMKGNDYVMKQWKECLPCIIKMEGCLTGCIEFHKKMEEKISGRGRERKAEKHPVLQEFAYLIVKECELSARSQGQLVVKLDFANCKDLVNRYDLAAYEKGVSPKTSYVGDLIKIILKEQLQPALDSGKVKEVLEGFGQLGFEFAVEFCEYNIRGVYACLRKCKSDISWARGDSWEYERGSINKEIFVRDFEQDDVWYTFEDWKKLFLYFCCMEDRDNVMKECLSIVMKKEGSLGVERFYQDLQNKRIYMGISENDKKKMEKKEKPILQKVINQDNNFGKEQISSKSKVFFLKSGGKIPKDDKQANDELENTFLDKKGKWGR